MQCLLAQDTLTTFTKVTDPKLTEHDLRNYTEMLFYKDARY